MRKQQKFKEFENIVMEAKYCWKSNWDHRWQWKKYYEELENWLEMQNTKISGLKVLWTWRKGEEKKMRIDAKEKNKKRPENKKG